MTVTVTLSQNAYADVLPMALLWAFLPHFWLIVLVDTYPCILTNLPSHRPSWLHGQLHNG